MDYQLKPQEISLLKEEYGKMGAVLAYEQVIADAASKKARNQTLKEVRDWLEACGLTICHIKDDGGDYDYLRDAEHYEMEPSVDDPNRFFPKEAE